MKALGVDYGEVRIGIACSDDLGMFAHPLETVQTCESSPIARIAEIVAQRSIEIIIIGMPRSLDGSYGKSAQNVSDFVDKIANAMPDIEVVTQDERFTTTVAQQKLHDAGHTIKSSRHLIDQAAAVEILQSYLDEKKDEPIQ
ncbi:MAG: Holliday junction resolvase RuvX [Verrucomicrobiota bacterium]|nr:Holliday junction resolvase RuvX [Verrucomicrobiota bacterium]MED5471247.1 Holliday junction resolvase RuvX [Verrucomicrobiota bacterium]MEE2966383.1 Holliday junction resolvase RuvX [Verrucomicrobiota bacterium]